MTSVRGSFAVQSSEGKARCGSLHTAHGVFSTPAFMPVGTQGTVKGVDPAALKMLGAEIILANTYHLHLRPGDELIRSLGGLHRFIGWDGPILTDSGGFQVFSLSKLRAVSDEGIAFQSHVDGRSILFTPERVVEIQENLGVDIMMVLDECVGYPADRRALEAALRRTSAWAKRAKNARRNPHVLAFGIVQGGMERELRRRSAEEIAELRFDGYAIGGLSVGEPPALMQELVDYTAQLLPRDQIRYLMGVGTPSDLVRAAWCGIDLFDCVIPTRSARFGRLFTESGYINIRNSVYRADPEPIAPDCGCTTCRRFSRAYLAHLVHAHEVLAVQLLSIHNLFFYQNLMKRIRTSIAEGEFFAFADRFLKGRDDTTARSFAE